MLAVWVLAAVGGAAVTPAAGCAVVNTHERHRAESHAVQAVLTRAVPEAMPTADGVNVQVRAPVRWTFRYGGARTATVSVEASGPAGSKVVFWTDRWGTPTMPPVSGADPEYRSAWALPSVSNAARTARHGWSPVGQGDGGASTTGTRVGADDVPDRHA